MNVFNVFDHLDELDCEMFFKEIYLAQTCNTKGGRNFHKRNIILMFKCIDDAIAFSRDEIQRNTRSNFCTAWFYESVLKMAIEIKASIDDELTTDRGLKK